MTWRETRSTTNVSLELGQAYEITDGVDVLKLRGDFIVKDTRKWFGMKKDEEPGEGYFSWLTSLRRPVSLCEWLLQTLQKTGVIGRGDDVVEGLSWQFGVALSGQLQYSAVARSLWARWGAPQEGEEWGVLWMTADCVKQETTQPIFVELFLCGTLDNMLATLDHAFRAGKGQKLERLFEGTLLTLAFHCWRDYISLLLGSLGDVPVNFKRRERVSRHTSVSDLHLPLLALDVYSDWDAFRLTVLRELMLERRVAPETVALVERQLEELVAFQQRKLLLRSYLPVREKARISRISATVLKDVCCLCGFGSE